MKKNNPPPRPRDKEAWSALGIQDLSTIRFAMDQLVRAGLDVLGADQGSLLLAEPRDKLLRFAMVVSARDGIPPPPLVGNTVPYGAGVTGMAALTHDVQSAAAADGATFHHLKGDGSPSAVLAAPLLSGDRLLGVLTAVSFAPCKSFSPDDARRYGIFANLAAIVVAQQRRLELLSSPSSPPPAPAVPSAEQSERALLESVLAFVRARPGRAEAIPPLLDALSRLP